jgi:hypothetical protein
MHKTTVKKTLLKAWLSCSDFFYTTVETLPSIIFTLVATLPIFIFWLLMVYKKPINHLPAIFYQDQLIQKASSWFNLAQDPTSLPASFLIFGLHTINISLFLYLARPYLSKLMLLWASWYIGIHPSHQLWLGKLEYLPYLLECMLALVTIIAIKKICTTSVIPLKRFFVISLILILWLPINIWFGAACAVLAAAYFWPLPTSQLTLLMSSYLIAQLITIMQSFAAVNTTAIFFNLRQTLVALFGLNWIPSSQQWLRYGFLIFWGASLIGLFLHTTKRRQAGLLVLAITAYLGPQVFIKIHPAYVYTALPAFITSLGLLYENTGEADMRSAIKSLIVPIYASFLFNVVMILFWA